MALRVEKTAPFVADFELRFSWYAEEGGDDLAFRFQRTLDETLERLANRPDLGIVRRFRRPRLQGLRSFQVNTPFNAVLIFYRVDANVLHAIRLMHGARDLPRRLRESPSA
jgi:plasmid stabilization system protein ParE